MENSRLDPMSERCRDPDASFDAALFPDDLLICTWVEFLRESFENEVNETLIRDGRGRRTGRALAESKDPDSDPSASESCS